MHEYRRHIQVQTRRDRRRDRHVYTYIRGYTHAGGSTGGEHTNKGLEERLITGRKVEIFDHDYKNQAESVAKCSSRCAAGSADVSDNGQVQQECWRERSGKRAQWHDEKDVAEGVFLYDCSRREAKRGCAKAATRCQITPTVFAPWEGRGLRMHLRGEHCNRLITPQNRSGNAVFSQITFLVQVLHHAAHSPHFSPALGSPCISTMSVTTQTAFNQQTQQRERTRPLNATPECSVQHPLPLPASSRGIYAYTTSHG